MHSYMMKTAMSPQREIYCAVELRFNVLPTHTGKNWVHSLRNLTLWFVLSVFFFTHTNFSVVSCFMSQDLSLYVLSYFRLSASSPLCVIMFMCFRQCLLFLRHCVHLLLLDHHLAGDFRALHASIC